MRRHIGFILTVITMVTVVHHVEYNPDLRERLLEDPWKSFGLLVLLILALASLAWSVIRPSALKTILAFGLGIATALWTGDLLDGIDGGQIAVLVGGVLGLVVLWAITCGPDRWFRGMSRWVANHLPQPSRPGDDDDVVDAEVVGEGATRFGSPRGA